MTWMPLEPFFVVLFIIYLRPSFNARRKKEPDSQKEIRQLLGDQVAAWNKAAI